MADTPDISPPPHHSWVGDALDLVGKGWNDVAPYIQDYEDEVKRWVTDASKDVPIDSDPKLAGTDFTLGQKKYDFTQRIFPSDLGEPGYNGHYMVININVSNYSQFNGRINGPAGSISTF